MMGAGRVACLLFYLIIILDAGGAYIQGKYSLAHQNAIAHFFLRCGRIHLASAKASLLPEWQNFHHNISPVFHKTHLMTQFSFHTISVSFVGL